MKHIRDIFVSQGICGVVRGHMVFKSASTLVVQSAIAAFQQRSHQLSRVGSPVPGGQHDEACAVRNHVQT